MEGSIENSIFWNDCTAKVTESQYNNFWNIVEKNDGYNSPASTLVTLC